jgi:hypothetical protein
MDILEKLRNINDVEIIPVEDPRFISYGRVLQGYDFSQLETYMEEQTEIPAEGNVYVASVDDMECMDAAVVLRDSLYGGMPVQIGYCNGKNSTFNGFEYHKGSEVNVAITDFMLCLGHSYDIQDNTYDIERAQVFFVPKGTAIEMYGTTLHLSPLRVWEDGFKGIVILPAGTNTPLSSEEKNRCGGGDPEQILLLQRNKWVIAHPQREPLIRQGAHPGVIGENKCLNYCSI